MLSKLYSTAYWAVFALALSFFTPAHAASEMVARDSSGNVIRLTHNACTIKDHKLFPAGIPPQFEAGSAIVGGQMFIACWGLLPNGIVLLIFEDGDVGEVPAVAFKPDGA